jgi:hypothetical protein
MDGVVAKVLWRDNLPDPSHMGTASADLETTTAITSQLTRTIRSIPWDLFFPRKQ